MTYELICEKLGFDPITDDIELNSSPYEDDSQVSPFSILTSDELGVFIEHLIANRDKLQRYEVK